MADVILKEEETIEVTLQEEEVIEVSLKEEEKPLDVELEDINYIPGYIAEEEKRRANEEERVAYYEDFKERVENGEFDGEDGPVYIAGENIEITEDNVINCTVKGGGGGGVSEEMDPTVPSYVKEITEEDINNWNNKSEFSGDYNDLINQPTIPTVPENVSAFKNDSGYLTEIPEEYVTTNELDGKGYLTEVPEGYVTDDDLDNYYTKEETESRLSEATSPINADINSLSNSLSRLSSYVDEETDLTTEATTISGAINEIDGNLENKQNKVLSGTDEPTTDLGEDGDVYYQIVDYDLYNNTYVGEETVVGTWFGETLYRNVYKVSVSNNANSSTPHGISGLKEVAKYTAHSLYNGVVRPVPYVTGSLYVLAEIDSTNIYIYNTTANPYVITLIMYYTKTS